MAHAWKNEDVVKGFINGGRKAIPFGQEQIDIMIRLISSAVPSIEHFVDLGCGDGILSHAVLTQYPNAKPILLDYSNLMLIAAEKRLHEYPNKKLIQGDLSQPNWRNSLDYKVDIVVSGYAIHHLSHGRKYELYQEIYDLLKPGGIFINVEHVASVSDWGEYLSDQLMMDTLYEYLLEQGNPVDKETLWEKHNNRLDKADNVLLSVETQCDWLREIGFYDVDCFFKSFELAVFAGRKA